MFAGNVEARGDTITARLIQKFTAKENDDIAEKSDAIIRASAFASLSSSLRGFHFPRELEIQRAITFVATEEARRSPPSSSLRERFAIAISAEGEKVDRTERTSRSGR